MSVTFLNYVWHYLAARAVYDELLRPLVHGRIATFLWLGSVAVVAFALGRWSRACSRPGQARGPRRRS